MLFFFGEKRTFGPPVIGISFMAEHHLSFSKEQTFWGFSYFLSVAHKKPSLWCIATVINNREGTVADGFTGTFQVVWQ